MEIERWKQIERVYNKVFDTSADKRSALLDETCAGDPDLRREVESLLSASDDPATFLSRQELQGHISRLASEPAAQVVGSTVGHYHVLSFLGAGAMGEVYLARDSILDRQVALKLLPEQYTQDPERVARFVREAKAASSLNHPNIITIHEIGQANGIWFIAAEYIEGVTLRERLALGKLTAEEAVDIGLQCAAALGAVHLAGIVHRDIKPENIMVRHDSVVKVVDFGLARILETRPEWALEATVTGSVMGTPRYMSPEQARAQTLDARTDIFSLGSVLAEMLTGRPAFPGITTAEVFAALLGSEPDLADAGPLGAVIARALAKNPAARYQAMEEFASALRARPLKRWPFWRAARKPALVASLVAAGLAAYIWIPRPGPREAALKFVPLATFAGAKGFPALSPNGARVAFSWKAPAAKAHHIYVKPVGEGEPVQLSFSPYDDVLPAWSPDGRQIAFCRQSNGDQDNVPQEILIVPADGGKERKVADGWRGLSWSPDGKTLALTRAANGATPPARESGGIFLLSLESGQSRDLTLAYKDTYPVFSPDGRWIAFKRYVSATEAQIFVIPAGGGPARRLTSNPFPIRGPTWTATSREIVFASLRSGSDGSLWRVSLQGGAPRPVSATLRDAFDPSISRQGRLAFREEWKDANLYLVTAQDYHGSVPGRFEDPVASLLNSSREDHSPAFSPDGERIAFASDRSGNFEIWVARRNGSQAVPLTSLRAQNTGSPRWSPDGRRIAFDSWASGTSAVYVVDSAGGLPRMITTGPFGSWMPFWSPDGKWIYFSRGHSAPANIWKIPSAGGEAVPVTRSGAFESRPSPDGKTVYFTKRTQDGNASIWSVPATGGAEEPVPELKAFRQIGRCWGVLEKGIYFISYEDSPRQTVHFLSFRTHRVTPLFPLQKQEQWGVAALTFSPDAHYALATQLDHAVNDVMMIENFR